MGLKDGWKELKDKVTNKLAEVANKFRKDQGSNPIVNEFKGLASTFKTSQSKINQMLKTANSFNKTAKNYLDFKGISSGSSKEKEGIGQKFSNFFKGLLGSKDDSFAKPKQSKLYSDLPKLNDIQKKAKDDFNLNPKKKNNDMLIDLTQQNINTLTKVQELVNGNQKFKENLGTILADLQEGRKALEQKKQESKQQFNKKLQQRKQGNHMF